MLRFYCYIGRYTPRSAVRWYDFGINQPSEIPHKQTEQTMKHAKFNLLVIILAVVMSGCSSLNRNAASDDLYSTHNKVAIAQREAAEAELAKAQALAEKARYEQMLAEQQADQAKQAYYNSLRMDDSRGTTVYADDGDVVVVAGSRYARKLYLFEDSDVYIMPSSYYAWNYSPYYDYYHHLPARYWSAYYGRWGWSYGYAGWDFHWYRPWYDPWYAPIHYDYGWYDPYWGPSWHAHHHHHHHCPVWPGWGPGAGSGGPHYGSNRPTHHSGYRTFDNGYKAPIASRQPSVSGASSNRGNSSSSNSGGNYRGNSPSRSDFFKPNRSNSNSSNPSRVNSNTSRPSSSGSSSSSSSSSTYRRGTSSSSSSSSNSSSRPTYSSGSSSFGSSSSGGFSGGGSSSSRGGSSSGSGRSMGGR